MDVNSFLKISILLLCISNISGRATNRSERLISEKLLEDKTSHPTKYLVPANFVNVTMSMSLNNILSVSPQRGEVEVVAYMYYMWRDNSLAWKKTDDNSPSQVSIPSSLIWTPDIVPYSATKPVEELFPTDVVVTNTGDVTWIQPIKMALSCDVTNYTTGSECKVKFGSWTSDDAHLDVHAMGDVIDLDWFASPIFTVLRSKMERVVQYYPCCKEGYPSVVFSFLFRER